LKSQFLKHVGQRPSTSSVGDDGLRVGVGAPLGSTLSRSLATSSPLLSRAQVFALDIFACNVFSCDASGFSWSEASHPLQGHRLKDRASG